MFPFKNTAEVSILQKFKADFSYKEQQKISSA